MGRSPVLVVGNQVEGIDEVAAVVGVLRAVRDVDGDTAPSEDNSRDDATAAQPNLFPSSFGLTCAVTGETQKLIAIASWGRYAKERTPETAETSFPTVWRRYAVAGQVPIPMQAGDFGPLSPARRRARRSSSASGRAGTRRSPSA